VSFMEYPEMPEGVVGKGSTHHFALRVDSAEEQEAWRDYLREHDVDCTDVFDRGEFHSIYVRDPDGHVVEIATRVSGFGAGGPPA
jgi:glyoxylase I family protein